MQRFHQTLFIFPVAATCWLLMMAVHELGHIIGAKLTGGQVEQIVLHPLAISRTDVSPNPHPAIVVWLGPIVGCLFPLALTIAIPRVYKMAGGIVQFFAGFCLVANGAYIGLGKFGQVGDCQEMMRTGSPEWVLLAFGASMLVIGFYQWHCLGSLVDFLKRPELVNRQQAYFASAVLISICLVNFAFQSR